MSRIGNLPVAIPDGVKVDLSKDNCLTVTGKLGELKQKIDPSIEVVIEDKQIILKRTSEQKQVKSYHGLYRSLVNNMVFGVSTGYTTVQELVGVGYKAEAKGQLLELQLGYSHPIFFELPKEIKVETNTEKRGNSFITLTSFDKQLIGQVAAKIRSLRPPEPYKGKGIKFKDEELRRKAGKTAAK
jgi:large subunit ribosomal protein L6